MAMTERSRNTLYRGLCDVIDDEEAVGEMLAQFPARQIDEPATKGDVSATEERLRAEIADVRTEIVAAETRTMAFVHAELRASMQWTIATMIALYGALIAALAIN